MLKKLYSVLTEADNKYMISFLGAKNYIKTHLKDQGQGLRYQTLHSCQQFTQCVKVKNKGGLNAPTVNKIAILLPSSDIITKKHKRQVKLCVYYLQSSVISSTYPPIVIVISLLPFTLPSDVLP